MFLRGSRRYGSGSPRPSSLMTPRPTTLMRAPGLQGLLPVHGLCADGLSDALPRGLPLLPRPRTPGAPRADPPTLGAVPAAKRAHRDDPERAAAITILAELALRFFPHAPIVQEAIADEGTFHHDSLTLVACFATKQTSTIAKRACSLKLYSTWFVTTGSTDSEFLTEPAVWR